MSNTTDALFPHATVSVVKTMLLKPSEMLLHFGLNMKDPRNQDKLNPSNQES